MSTARSTRPLVRVHAALGCALGGFVIWHLVQCLALVEHPTSFVIAAVHRTEAGRAGLLAVAVVVLAALHGVLGVNLARSRPGRSAVDRDLDRVQFLAGVLGLSFVAYHVVQMRLWDSGPHLGAYAAYGVLLRALGSPLDLAVYVVGVTAICFHASFGAARVLSGAAAGTPVLRWSFAVLGVLLWGLWLQPLAKLATGWALF